MELKNFSKKDLNSLVTSIAPLLGSVLGGPSGAIAGSLIAGLFGADPKNPNEILQKIISTPDYEYKLQKLEQDHEENLKSMNVRIYEAEVDNLKNARDNNTKSNDGVVHVMAIGYSGLFAGIFIVSSLDIVKVDPVMFQFIYSIAMIIVNYYFGSSYRKSSNNNLNK